MKTREEMLNKKYTEVKYFGETAHELTYKQDPLWVIAEALVDIRDLLSQKEPQGGTESV